MKNVNFLHPQLLITLLAGLVLLMAGCGGGGSSPAQRTWSIAALIETDNTGDAGTPQIAFDSSGNAMAVWTQSDGTRANIWANRYSAGTGWGTAALIETSNAGNAYNVQIAFDSSGNAMAVWQQSDGTRDNIWVNRFHRW